ncbi:MAG: FtsQ-type POTRA domain-containing protein [Polaromonas sp.]|nr:MAG: FtsQ-type POTRA domain-containing protein [Polaromonas sp.]
MNALSVLLSLVLVAMVLALGASWLMRQSVFNLSAISVQGDVAHNNAVTLRANVAPRLEGNFFTVDMARVRAVFESAPWVRKAVVHRQFPNRLRVVLQEHQAVAFWGSEGDTRLLNSFGEVFDANQGEVEADELPQLNGPVGQAALVLQAFEALSPLFEQFDTVLQQLELSSQGSWRAQLDSGADIELGHGSPEEVRARCERFLVTLSQVSSRYGRELESADLRYGNGYALKIRGVTTVDPGDKTHKANKADIKVTR